MELSLGFVTPLTRIKLFIPVGLGDLSKSKLQVHDGAQFVDLQSPLAIGAAPVSGPDGWSRSWNTPGFGGCSSA